MLHVYTKKELIPSGMEFIYDADAFFNMQVFKDTEFNRIILENYELGKYLDTDSFIDRLGYRLPLSYMSTSAKILSCIKSFPDKCINGIEMGVDAYNLLVDIDDGYVYISDRPEWIEDTFCETRKSVEVDGEVWSW